MKSKIYPNLINKISPHEFSFNQPQFSCNKYAIIKSGKKKMPAPDKSNKQQMLNVGKTVNCRL